MGIMAGFNNAYKVPVLAPKGTMDGWISCKVNGELCCSAIQSKATTEFTAKRI